jgi:hypothetical protein
VRRAALAALIAVLVTALLCEAYTLEAIVRLTQDILRLLAGS